MCRGRKGPDTCKEGSLFFTLWVKGFWENFLPSFFLFVALTYVDTFTQNTNIDVNWSRFVNVFILSDAIMTA